MLANDHVCQSELLFLFVVSGVKIFLLQILKVSHAASKVVEPLLFGIPAKAWCYVLTLL